MARRGEQVTVLSRRLVVAVRWSVEAEAATKSRAQLAGESQVELSRALALRRLYGDSNSRWRGNRTPATGMTGLLSRHVTTASSENWLSGCDPTYSTNLLAQPRSARSNPLAPLGPGSLHPAKTLTNSSRLMRPGDCPPLPGLWGGSGTLMSNSEHHNDSVQILVIRVGRARSWL